MAVLQNADRVASDPFVDGAADAGGDVGVSAHVRHRLANAPGQDEHQRCGQQLLDALDPCVFTLCKRPKPCGVIWTRQKQRFCISLLSAQSLEHSNHLNRGTHLHQSRPMIS